MIPNGTMTISQKAVDAAVSVNLDDSDILLSTYHKTGNFGAQLLSKQLCKNNYMKDAGLKYLKCYKDCRYFFSITSLRVPGYPVDTPLINMYEGQLEPRSGPHTVPR